MSKSGNPQPRPALQRAADAEVHPALVVPVTAQNRAKTGANTKAKKVKKPARTIDLTSKSAAKPVDLQVQIPKSLRKQLKRRAKELGVSMDELTAQALVNHLGDSRWW